MTRAAAARLGLIIMSTVGAAGCVVVAGIFKAGVWVGLILGLLVVALVMWVAGRARR